MAIKLIASSNPTPFVTGLIGSSVSQIGKTITIFASATSWGTLTRVLIEATADNGTTWMPVKDRITGDNIIIEENSMFEGIPLGKDVFVRARVIQVIGTPINANIWLNEVWL